MIKIEHVVLPSPEQMEFVIEGMRNPKNSWNKSDSDDCCIYDCYNNSRHCPKGGFCVGADDLKLMTTLAQAGTEHRKYMRMMPVMLRITAPLYWWKEFDTYKVGTVANSCSTMHKIAAKKFTLDDFSCEHLYEESQLRFRDCDPLKLLNSIIGVLNNFRSTYLETKDNNDWWQMIQLLPSSYNQTRNVMLNYEVLANIYRQRRNHKLDEWHVFCDWVDKLPYAKELIIGEWNGN